MAALTTNDWWVENAPPPMSLADVAQRGGTRVPTNEPVSAPYEPPTGYIPNTTPGQPGLGGSPYPGGIWQGPNTSTGQLGSATNYQQLFQQLTGGQPPSPAVLEALAPELAKYGIVVNKNAAGIAGKITLPTGQVVDVIEGASVGGKNWQWLTGDGGGGAMGQNGSLYAPYAGTFTGGGQYPLASVMGPGFMQPWTTPFQAPNDVTQQNDPGWQFRMREGLNAIEKSAAAKGTLLSGGTLKALNSWAQDYASNEYDKVYGRALGEYQQAYGIYNQNLNNQWGRLGTLAAPGVSAATSLANMATGYGANLADLYGAQGNALATGQATSGGIYGAMWPQLGNIAAGTVPYWWPQGGGGATNPYLPGAPVDPTGLMRS